MKEILVPPKYTTDVEPRTSCCPMCECHFRYHMTDGYPEFSLGTPETINVVCPSCGYLIRSGLFVREKAYAFMYWDRQRAVWKNK